MPRGDPDACLEVLRFCGAGEFGHEPRREHSATLAIQILDFCHIRSAHGKKCRQEDRLLGSDWEKDRCFEFCDFFRHDSELRNQILHLPTGRGPDLVPIAADRECLAKHRRDEFHLVGKLHRGLQSGPLHFLRKPPADLRHFQCDRGRTVVAIRLR